MKLVFSTANPNPKPKVIATTFKPKLKHVIGALKRKGKATDVKPKKHITKVIPWWFMQPNCCSPSRIAPMLLLSCKRNKTIELRQSKVLHPLSPLPFPPLPRTIKRSILVCVHPYHHHCVHWCSTPCLSLYGCFSPNSTSSSSQPSSLAPCWLPNEIISIEIRVLDSFCIFVVAACVELNMKTPMSLPLRKFLLEVCVLGKSIWKTNCVPLQQHFPSWVSRTWWNNSVGDQQQILQDNLTSLFQQLCLLHSFTSKMSFEHVTRRKHDGPLPRSFLSDSHTFISPSGNISHYPSQILYCIKQHFSPLHASMYKKLNAHTAICKLIACAWACNV